MQRIKRFCNALFFMSYIIFHTIVFKNLLVHFTNTNKIHFHFETKVIQNWMDRWGMRVAEGEVLDGLSLYNFIKICIVQRLLAFLLYTPMNISLRLGKYSQTLDTGAVSMHSGPKLTCTGPGPTHTRDKVMVTREYQGLR